MNGSAPDSALRSGLPPIVVVVAVTFLVALHFFMAVYSKSQKSTTSDEIAHLTAGVSYWKNHDYRLQPENGILPQRWAALPTVLDGATLPALKDNTSWRTSHVWLFGYQFFYETHQDHFPRLMWGRAMVALVSAATAILVFIWSRRLFGNVGGFISLILYTFCPTFLAHGALVTSDMCMTFFFLAATGAWWWHLHDGRASIWWLSALTFGLAFVAKYSAVLLLPMMVLMAVFRALSSAPLFVGGRTFSTWHGKFGAAALSAVGHALVVALVIWTCYGFRYSAFNSNLPPADHFIRSWTYMASGLGPLGGVIHTLAKLEVLPEAFLYGLTYVLKTASVRAAFLNGEYSVTGWPTFFPWAFLLKTTPPLLILCLLTGGLALRRWAHTRTWANDIYRVTPLIVLFSVYWISSLMSHLNIGHRHLMPTYPVLFIAAGMLGTRLISRWWIRLIAVVGLLGWHVVESSRAAPHYLAYFNMLGGGSDNGWRHLVDSSLDWGQDLPGLKAWIESRGDNEPVFLSYFGTGEPDYYGIDAIRMPFFNLFGRQNPWYEPKAGSYCISATMLQQVYSRFRGEWRIQWEKEYQEGRAKEPLFREYWTNHARRNELVRANTAIPFEETWARYDELRFARLCHYLRVRAPDANVGHSILIYHLSESEVAGGTTGTLSDWRALIEKAAAEKP